LTSAPGRDERPVRLETGLTEEATQRAATSFDGLGMLLLLEAQGTELVLPAWCWEVFDTPEAQETMLWRLVRAVYEDTVRLGGHATMSGMGCFIQVLDGVDASPARCWRASRRLGQLVWPYATAGGSDFFGRDWAKSRVACHFEAHKRRRLGTGTWRRAMEDT
jgi:hypothetical protein